jgi:methyl-accepting chemotaxis protein
LAQIDTVTQQNTASSEENAAVAEQLSSQAGFLQELVAKFKLHDQAAGDRLLLK